MVNRRKGFSVLELLLMMYIIAVFVLIAIPICNSFFSRINIHNGLRRVTAYLNQGRYLAVKKNKPIKLETQNNRLILKEKIKGKWFSIRFAEMDKGVSISFSAFPVFQPNGSVSPLCSIHLKNSRHKFKTTLSIAGRIKVVKLQ